MTRSIGLVVVRLGVEMLAADVPLPLADASGAPADATPDHSDTFIAADFDADSVAVTLVADGPPRRYQISMRVLVPLRTRTGPLTHDPLAESVTERTEAELPAATAISATSVSPAVDADWSGATRLVPVPPFATCCTSEIAPGGETVTVTVADELVSDGSVASYVNESGPVKPVFDVYVPLEQSGFTVAVPFVAWLTMEQVSVSPSGSDTTGVQEAAVAVVALKVTGPAVGGWFTPAPNETTTAAVDEACLAFR